MGCHPGKVITIYQFSMLFTSAFFRAFTPRNITASFRATGVFPPNRRAIPIPGYSQTTKDVATPTAKVAQRQGIQYLPFYSPPCSKEVSQVPSFTAAETERFQVRFEEGYDLTHDERYNLWLQVHHPNSGPGVRKELSFDSYLHSSEESSFSESWTGEGKVPFGEIPTGGGSPAIEGQTIFKQVRTSTYGDYSTSLSGFLLLVESEIIDAIQSTCYKLLRYVLLLLYLLQPQVRCNCHPVLRDRHVLEKWWN